MRSLVERSRLAAEWGLRAISLALLAWWLVRALGGHAGVAEERADGDGLGDALARWSTVAAPARVRVGLTEPPPAAQREWLAALAGAGTAVAWGGDAATPTALAVERVADPAGGVRALVALPSGAAVTLGDEAGPLDSIPASGEIARFHVGATPDSLSARVAGVVAHSVRPDSLVLRPVLLIGQGGWEAKFVTAALEERGWKVDALMVVSPKSDVLQGRVAALDAAIDAAAVDTARYSAAVLLDTTAVRYAPLLRRYLAAGGGLVLWPGAAGAAAFAPLVAGRPGEQQPGADILPSDTAPRLRLPLSPILALRDDAVVLERRGDAAAVAARRVGLGRLVQVGYDDVWKWRMRGGEDAPEDHRAWLSGLVAGVAYTGAGAGAQPLALPDDAPLVALVDWLGAPVARSEIGPAADQGSRRAPPVPIFAVLCAVLLLEWTSRRLRGAR